MRRHGSIDLYGANFEISLYATLDKAQALRNSFPSTFISYRKKNQVILPELNDFSLTPIGTPDGKFWEIKKKTKKKNSHFSILGDFWEKFIFSSLPESLMDEFPASKVHLQPIRNWVWSTGEIHPFQGERREGGLLKNSTYQLTWAQNPVRHPELSISQQDVPSKDTIIFELPASKHLPEEQTFWGTDPLGEPSSTLELSSLLNVWEILYFGSHSWHLNGRLLRHFDNRYCEQYLYLRASTKLL